MGSAAGIYNQKMNRRVKWLSYVSIPMLAVGTIALFLQLFFYTNSTNFFLFDFNSGILWKWQEEEESDKRNIKLVQKFFPENLIAANFSSPEKFQSIFQKDPITVIQKAADIPMNAEQIGKPERTVEIEAIAMGRIDAPSNFKVLLPGEAIKRLESSTVFNPNIRCKTSRISVGISFAPALSYRTLKYANEPMTAAIYSGNNTRVSGQTESGRNMNDRMIVSIFGGADVYIQYSPKISFQTGVYYASYGEQLNVQEINSHDPNLNMADKQKNPAFCGTAVYSPVGDGSETEATAVPFTNQFKFIEIPFLVNYNLKHRRYAYEVQTGFSMAFLDHADALVYDFGSHYYYWVSSSDFELFNRTFFTGIAGISINQMISKTTEIFANPQLRYVFTPTFKTDYPANQHQYAAGLRMGIKVYL